MPREQLSDNWRRTICRCAFLLFCILPTLTTGYWIFHPQTVGDWERTIRAELGISTEIDSIETPGPNVTILRGIRFADPLAGELLTTTQIRVIRGRPNRIVIDYPTSVSCESLVKLVKKASENLTASNTGTEWRLEFGDDATIYSKVNEHGYAPSIATSNLTVDFSQYTDGPAAEVKFFVKGSPANSLVSGYMHRTLGAPAQFGLQTGGNFLPCWLLGDLVKDLNRLGTESQFDGQILIAPWELDRTQLNCEITGTFKNIELKQLVSEYKHLEGVCTATVEKLLIRNEQIHSMSARLGSAHGSIGTQMLTSASLNLGLLGEPIATDHRDESIAYRNLELTCRLENGLLAFGGDNDGVIAFDVQGQPWIGCDNTRVHTLDNLAHFLVKPDVEAERVTEDTMAFLNRFHRPAPAINNEPILRTSDNGEESWK